MRCLVSHNEIGEAVLFCSVVTKSSWIEGTSSKVGKSY
jgi:hypothetical protein